jgi:hypothetical protein
MSQMYYCCRTIVAKLASALGGWSALFTELPRRSEFSEIGRPASGIPPSSTFVG